jgi:glyoxylate/hydroxypyruvate reductase A
MIPFISQLPINEQAIWLETLSRVLPNETIVLSHEVPKEERHLCKLAIVANPDLTSLSSFENLHWLHSVWAGVEKLMETLKSSPIKVVRLIDPMLSQTMAEAVLAWSLYLHRDMPAYAKQQQQKQWRQQPYTPANERRIGILGLGELGCASAKGLRDHGFNVLGWSRTPKVLADISTFSGTNGLLDMVSQSDILVCLLPLTPVTRNLVNAELLNNMSAGSSVINFARGGIIDVNGLLKTLDSGQISHAVLDVFEQEPLSITSELWQHPNITVLPHISAPTNINSACDIVAKNILHYRKTDQLPVCVDKDKGY